MKPKFENPVTEMERDAIFALTKHSGYTIDDAIVFYGIYALVKDGITAKEIDRLFANKKHA